MKEKSEHKSRVTNMSVDFYQIKQSHEELIRKYSELIENSFNINTQPCSIFKSHLLITFSDVDDSQKHLFSGNNILSGFSSLILKSIVSIYVLFNIGFFVLSFLFSKIPMVVKFLTRTTIQSHIKSRLKKISKFYKFKKTQLCDQPEIKILLTQFQEDCDALSSTIDVTIFNLFNIIKIFLVSSPLLSFFKEYQDFIKELGQLWVFISILGGVGLVSSFVFFPFIQKRYFLLINKIYYLEDNFFKSTNQYKNKEFPWDLVALVFILIGNFISLFILLESSSIDFVFIVIDVLGLIILFLTRQHR